jgi:hypothetical protein
MLLLVNLFNARSLGAATTAGVLEMPFSSKTPLTPERKIVPSLYMKKTSKDHSLLNQIAAVSKQLAMFQICFGSN